MNINLRGLSQKSVEKLCSLLQTQEDKTCDTKESSNLHQVMFWNHILFEIRLVKRKHIRSENVNAVRFQKQNKLLFAEWNENCGKKLFSNKKKWIKGLTNILNGHQNVNDIFR